MNNPGLEDETGGHQWLYQYFLLVVSVGEVVLNVF